MNEKNREEIRKIVGDQFDSLMKAFLHPDIKIMVLPGGAPPRRQTDGAIGFDVHLRRIVDPWLMDPDKPYLRKTLFDFGSVVEPSIADLVERRIVEGTWKRSRPTYRLDPGEKVLCSAGFVVEMPFPLCYLMLCRSGIASRHHITIANAPGTIDPDYRGEAGVVLDNRSRKPFSLYRGMRIAQIRFDWAIIPKFRRVQSYGQFSQTARMGNGFGWTGFH